ncbi:hypothetical protein P886_1483 [Alteromonadaceae bacterium 2753L.S.0a.02]|nr:hypothetical protein P886_1483 [Alteromonadaceae bacterium 2753L.S.0a.02]
MKLKNMLAAAFVFYSAQASADYDNNFRGKVLDVLTYPYSKNILIRVEGQPNSHPLCTRFDYMVIDGAIDSEARQLVYTRLLLAFARGENVNIGYDSKDECVGSRVKVYRVG